MGHLFSSFLLAISSDLDTFAVGIAYGVKKIRIGVFSNLIIALIAAFGTYTSMSVGAMISKILPQSIANLLGASVLLIIGVWSIWEAIKTEKQQNKKQKSSDISYNTFIEDPGLADLDNSRSIDVRESIPLGLALTINNLAGGIGGGVSGINILLTTFLTLIFSFLAIVFGYFLGANFTSKMSGKASGILSGCLIIAIAIYEYLH